MDPKQALAKLDQAASILNLTREQHDHLKFCTEIIGEALDMVERESMSESIKANAPG